MYWDFPQKWYATDIWPNSALFILSSTMGAIYEEHKDEDGFLYIAYSGENTFGMWWKIFKMNLSFTWLCFFAWIYFFGGEIRLA